MTYLSDEQVTVLLKPIHPRRVLVRDGMSYVEGYDIRAELNRVFGFGRWSQEILDQAAVCETQVKTKGGKDAWYVVYRTRMRLTVNAPDGTEITHYDGSHVGESTHPVRGEAHGNALTNSETYALRRCAINLGDQFGLSLYNKGSAEALVRWTLVRPESSAAPDTDDVPQVAAEQPESGKIEDTAPAPGELAPWKTRVDAACTTADLDAINSDLHKRYGDGDISAAGANMIKAAIDARTAELSRPRNQGPRPVREAAAPEDAGESGWVRDFHARLAETGDASGIRERRLEIARAVAAKQIAPETGNDLGKDLQKRADKIRDAA